MTNMIVIFAVSIAFSMAQTVFTDRQNFESIETNFQSQNKMVPQLNNGKFGLYNPVVDNQGAVQGRAEIKFEDQWGTICDDSFDIIAADVFCRSINHRSHALNWTKAGASYQRDTYFDRILGQKRIFMSDVSCSGKETSLDQCKYNNQRIRCTHFEDVVVVCLGFNNFTVNGDYRLANPKNITHSNGTFLGVWGRAEIFYGNNWNQLCSLDFILENAKVICRSLNLPLNDVRFSNAEQLSQIFNQDLLVKEASFYSNTFRCSGKESSLAACTQIQKNFCSHANDIYVQCSK